MYGDAVIFTTQFHNFMVIKSMFRKFVCKGKKITIGFGGNGINQFKASNYIKVND